MKVGEVIVEFDVEDEELTVRVWGTTSEEAPEEVNELAEELLTMLLEKISPDGD